MARISFPFLNQLAAAAGMMQGSNQAGDRAAKLALAQRSADAEAARLALEREGLDAKKKNDEARLGLDRDEAGFKRFAFGKEFKEGQRKFDTEIGEKANARRDDSEIRREQNTIAGRRVDVDKSLGEAGIAVNRERIDADKGMNTERVNAEKEGIGLRGEQDRKTAAEVLRAQEEARKAALAEGGYQSEYEARKRKAEHSNDLERIGKGNEPAVRRNEIDLELGREAGARDERRVKVSEESAKKEGRLTEAQIAELAMREAAQKAELKAKLSNTPGFAEAAKAGMTIDQYVDLVYDQLNSAEGIRKLVGSIRGIN